MGDRFSRDIVALMAVDAGLTVDKTTLPLYCRLIRSAQAYFEELEKTHEKTSR